MKMVSMQVIRRIRIYVFLILLTLLNACGGGNSSSDNNASTITIDDVTLMFVSTKITAGGAVELAYDLGGENITATLSWDDGHVVELIGSGRVRHGYDIAGSYSVEILIHGGESSLVEVIVVSPPEPEPEPESESESESESSTNTRSAPSSTVTFSCSAGSSVRASSASTGQVYILTHYDSSSGSAVMKVEAEDVSGGASVGIVYGFSACGYVSGSITSNKVINGNAVTFQISLTGGSNPEWTVSIL